MPPEDLRCVALTSTSLQISWQPPPLSHQNGLLQGYKVSFETISDDYRNGECRRESRYGAHFSSVVTQSPHENAINTSLMFLFPSSSSSSFPSSFFPIFSRSCYDKRTTENEEIDTRKTTALTTVLTSLRKFSNYSIQVLGYTRMGDGVSSQAIFCKTDEDGKFVRAICVGVEEKLNHFSIDVYI